MLIQLLMIVAVWILFNGGIGAAIGHPKGLSIDGLVYGTMLGPIGWLVVLLKQPTAEAQVRREHELDAARRK